MPFPSGSMVGMLVLANADFKQAVRKLKGTVQKAGFDPAQPRDDHGRWGAGGGGLPAKKPFWNRKRIVTAAIVGTEAAILVGLVGYGVYRELKQAKFHGTSMAALAGILQNGIVPQASAMGGDYFPAITNASTQQTLTEFAAKAKGYTFVSTSMATAKEYAKMVATHNEKHPIILKVDVPTREWLKSFWTDTAGGMFAYKHKGTIPPEWIQGVYTRTGKYVPIERLKKVDGAKTVYVVVVTVDDPEQEGDASVNKLDVAIIKFRTAIKKLSATVLKTDYDNNQPRDTDKDKS